MAPLEPWEKVLITSDFTDKDPHGTLKCVKCHNGDDTASDKETAHATLVTHPSEQSDKYCTKECHQSGTVKDTLDVFPTSLHFNQNGFYKRFSVRAGFDIATNEHLKEEFDKECGSCHTSCGQCHISRPISAGSGFIKGHVFQDTPDLVNNCTACHGSRVGAEYLNQNTTYKDLDGNPIKGDVHRFKKFFDCEDCHTGTNMHGNGTDLTYRYDANHSTRAQCENCHSGTKESNDFHVAHWTGDPKMACQVCHSQPYKSCNGCHVAGDGITGTSYQTLKIAKNYLKSADRPYDYITVRHIPIAPDTYANWGGIVSELANYTAEPTWKLATPHNIQRWTAQTTVEEGAQCFSKCHDNANLYLLQADIKAFNDSSYVDKEIEANSSLFMDDKMP